MNYYDELKLAVYESGIDFTDACEIIDIMETCKEDELDDVLFAVSDTVFNESERTDREMQDVIRSTFAAQDAAEKSLNKTVAPFKTVSTVASIAGGTAAAVSMVKLRSLNKELKDQIKLIKKTKNPKSRRMVKARIDELRREIKITQKKMIADAALAGTGVASNIALDRAKNTANKKMENSMQELMRDTERTLKAREVSRNAQNREGR